MPDVTRACRWSEKPFLITEADQTFYEKIGVSLPTLCPEERQRRRLVWRNERFLYPATCDSCERSIISVYDTSTVSFPVYCDQCWWSDAFDPTVYGCHFDFNRSFFEQFAELAAVVPRLAIMHTNSENSDYTLNSVGNKNGYFTSGADYNEDCFYGINSQRCKNCVDSYLIYDSELSYGCIDCINVYASVGCQFSENLSDCWFVFDGKGSRHCAFSSNIRNKEYVLFNRQRTKEEYERELHSTLDTLFIDPHWIKAGLKQVRARAVHPWVRVVNSENVSGHTIKNSKDCHHVFDAEGLQDCSYIYYALDVKDSYDLSCIGFKSSRLYELMSGGINLYDCHFSNGIMFSNTLDYCILAFNSDHLFGSIAMKRRQFCLLNKSYSEAEYPVLRERVVAHMRETGEWGEFFPPQLSPYEYNRSAAIDYMPLSREQAIRRGFRWYDGVLKIPHSTGQAVLCKVCGRAFRWIKQECEFYARLKIPAPHLCWECRLRDYIDLRGPRSLFLRPCSKCGTTMQTSYAPERPEKVYCEACYLNKMY